MRPFGVVIRKVFVDLLLEPWDVLGSVFQISETFFPENAVEPLNESLLVLLVRSCCPDAFGMPFGILFAIPS